MPEKIGVDPYSGGNFKGTSDQFFSKNNKNLIVYLLMGFMSTTRFVKIWKIRLIVLMRKVLYFYMMLYANVHQQAVPRYKVIWNGDVWKSIVNYRTRDDCDIVTCKIDHGVSVVRKITNKKPLKNISI